MMLDAYKMAEQLIAENIGSSFLRRNLSLYAGKRAQGIYRLSGAHKEISNDYFKTKEESGMLYIYLEHSFFIDMLPKFLKGLEGAQINYEIEEALLFSPPYIAAHRLKLISPELSEDFMNDELARALWALFCLPYERNYKRALNDCALMFIKEIDIGSGNPLALKAARLIFENNLKNL